MGGSTTHVFHNLRAQCVLVTQRYHQTERVNGRALFLGGSSLGQALLNKTYSVRAKNTLYVRKTYVGRDAKTIQDTRTIVVIPQVIALV